MGKVIEFYVPTGFSTRVRWLPPQQRGRVIEFRLPSIDHFDVLLQKIEEVRSEIADIGLFMNRLVFEAERRRDAIREWRKA
jgi:hypothetical protein